MYSDENSSENFVLTAGGLVDEASITLAIYGEDLIPEDISQLLCCQASDSIRRGERRTPKSLPYERSAWFLNRKGKAPIAVEEIIREILSLIPTDLDLWKNLSSQYDVQLRISIHMENWNKGFDLSPEIVRQIAQLDATIVFDIYAYVDDNVNDTLDNLLEASRQRTKKISD